MNVKSVSNEYLNQRLDYAIEKISDVDKKIEIVDKKLESNYITREEFEPIKKGFYGVIGIIGISTLGALLKLIFIK